MKMDMLVLTSRDGWYIALIKNDKYNGPTKILGNENPITDSFEFDDDVYLNNAANVAAKIRRRLQDSMILCNFIHTEHKQIMKNQANKYGVWTIPVPYEKGGRKYNTNTSFKWHWQCKANDNIVVVLDYAIHA